MLFAPQILPSPFFTSIETVAPFELTGMKLVTPGVHQMQVSSDSYSTQNLFEFIGRPVPFPPPTLSLLTSRPRLASLPERTNAIDSPDATLWMV